MAAPNVIASVSSLRTTVALSGVWPVRRCRKAMAACYAIVCLIPGMGCILKYCRFPASRRRHKKNRHG